jgi:Ca-activated chloride channel homolog
MTRNRRLRSVNVAALLVCAAVLLLVGGCGGSGSSTSSSGSTTISAYDPNSKVLNLVAGSEQQKVLTDVVVPWCRQHGYTCRYTLLGSVDQARLLQAGNAPYDAFWFASSVFEQLGDQSNVLKDVQPMFITPIVFAGWKSEMQRLGLVGRQVSIGDIVKLVESKQTTVWATNPTQSNSGATALFAFLNYFAGNPATTQLSMQQLNTAGVQNGIKEFTRAIAKTPPSTGTMMDDCVAHPSECKTLFTYEDLVIEKDQELARQGHEPLYAVYPQGGLAISDAPLGFLPHGSNPGKEQTFLALQHYLLSPAGQAKVEAFGRRPHTSIGLSLPGANPKVFNPDWGIQATVNEPIVHYPNAQVIQAALNNYQLSYRSPVSDYYCIDGSASMGDNGGWDGVTKAAALLFDPTQEAQYLLQISPRDITTVDVFDTGLKGTWTVSGNKASKLLRLRDSITALGPGGGTGIFHCLDRAAAHFRTQPNQGFKRLVILMTDGMDNAGGDTAAIAALHIPVIAIGFGNDADMGTLERIANETGGAAFPATNVVQALRQATGYK